MFSQKGRFFQILFLWNSSVDKFYDYKRQVHLHKIINQKYRVNLAENPRFAYTKYPIKILKIAVMQELIKTGGLH
jgi:hypothetical protein